MKISYRTHPVLKMLEGGSLGSIPVGPDDEFFFRTQMAIFRDPFKRFAKEFKRNIYFISTPFEEAKQKASIKLLELHADIANNNITSVDHGSTFIKKVDGVDYCIMYHQKFTTESEYIDIAIYAFTKEGLPVYFYVNTNNTQIAWVSNHLPLTERTEYHVNLFIHKQIAECTITEMFKQYAEVETKHLPPKSRTKDIDCKYINDTDLNITTLDSRWFTNLVKSDAFKVRGHFRLQAHGEGMKQRKLIWINDFQKEGYTAKARKL